MALTIAKPTGSARFGTRRVYDAPTQLAVVGALWFAYTSVRNLVGDTRRTALANAARLLDFESALGIDIEGSFQLAIDQPEAFVAANSYYLLHFPVTVGVAAFAFYRSRSKVFPALRNSVVGSTGIALLVHLAIPMAPPRMLPGFIDTGEKFGPDPYAIAGSESANQFAALPSLHVGWAVLVGFAIWQLSTNRLVRGVAVLHPILTSLVVVITGHHFVSDIVLGAAIALAALYMTIRAGILSQTLRASSEGTPAAGGPPRLT